MDDKKNSDIDYGIGSVIYPGIKQIVSASYSRSHGITPDVCLIEMAPQTLEPKDPDYTAIEPEGYLIFQFDTVKANTDLFGKKTTTGKTTLVLMQSCRPDKAQVRRSTTSENWTIPIFDRRWKWKYGSFSGHWNIKKNGVIVKHKEKTARELADMCLDAMGEIKYETKALDDLEKNKKLPYRKKVRSEVHWDRIPPAQALNDLVTPIGYRVCLGWDDIVRIEKKGEGELLPLKDLMSRGFEASLAETPDSITVLGGHTMHEALWELEPVGLDIDGEWRPIYHLSYVPVTEQGDRDWRVETPGVFGMLKSSYKDLKSEKTPKKEELRKRKDQYNLALQTVYRCYRLLYPFGTKEHEPSRLKYDQLGDLVAEAVNDGKRRGDRDFDRLINDYEEARRKLFLKSEPVIPGPQVINPKTGQLDDLKLEEIEQVLPTFKTRAELAIDAYTSKLIRKPVEVSGIFYDSTKLFNVDNPEEKISTFEGDNIDVMAELGIIRFSEPIYQFKKEKISSGKNANRLVQELPFPADLRVLIATPLKNLAGEPARFEHVEELDEKYKTKPAKLPLNEIKEKPKKVPKETDTKVVIKNEIVQAYQAQYETTLNFNGKYETNLVQIVDNVVEEELEDQALAAIDVENIKIQSENAGSGVYAGLKKINPDGAIQQVTITLKTSGGMTTTIARNSEVEIIVPTFDQRQRDLTLKEMIKSYDANIDNTQKVEVKG